MRIGAAAALAVVMAVTGVMTAVSRASGADDAAAAGPDAPYCVVRSSEVPHDLLVVGSEPVAGHPRATTWTFASAAMSGREVKVNVLLPEGYSQKGRAKKASYPVLFLFHGHGGSHRDWLAKADAVGRPLEAILGGRGVIVVMPDGGYNGWYSDWYGLDVDGHNGTDAETAPGWTGFHIGELLPWVDESFATNGTRLVAGLSMGGFGAMSYAGRHPELFTAAGSFSGAVDMRLASPAGPLGMTLASNLPDGQRPDACIWGDPVLQEERWKAHNPTDLVPRLSALRLWFSSGDGVPGPGDPLNQSTMGGAFTEAGIRQMNESFQRALTAAGVEFESHLYSPGVHTWNYWIRELESFVGWAFPVAS